MNQSTDDSSRTALRESPAFGSLQGGRLDRLDFLIIGIVFVVAVVFRLFYLFCISKSPLFDSPILDAEAHDQWARMIVEGVSAFPNSAYFKAPLYPYVLAVVRIVTGDLYWAPRILQIVMGAASCGFVYLVGREAFSRAVGAIAGFAAACYWVMIYFDAELLLEPLSIFLTLISLWLILHGAKRESIGWWVAAGLFMGLSAINRPNVLVFIPFIALWLLWIGWQRRGAAMVKAIAWCAACMLPILPVTIRNWVVGEDLVLIASQAGPNFYIGNNPKSDGYTANLPGSRSTWLGGFQDWTSMAEQELGRKLKASEVDRFFFDKAWEFIWAHRGKAALLAIVKLQLFLYEWEIPNDSDLHSMAGIYAPWITRIPVTSGAILALGLIGFVMCLADFKRLLPLTGYVVLYSATVIAFFVCSRFRVPVMPVAIVLAAIVPVKMVSYLRERDFRYVAALAIFTLIAWKGVNPGLPPELLNKYAAVSHHRIGLKLGEKNLPGEVEHLETALRLDPNCEEAESGFAYYYKRKGDRPRAIKHFQRALEISPEMDLHADLATLLAQEGRWDEALATVREGLARLPGYLDLKRKLAFMLATCPIDRLRDGKEAVRLAEEVASVGEEIPQTYDTLAVAYAEVGRFEEAVRADEKGLELAKKMLMPDAIEQITARLRLFRERKPFRQSVGITSTSP